MVSSIDSSSLAFPQNDNVQPLHHLILRPIPALGDLPLDNLMGAFDAAGLAVEAVGGAEHQGIFFKAIDLTRAEVFAGMNAEISSAAIALAGV